MSETLDDLIARLDRMADELERRAQVERWGTKPRYWGEAQGIRSARRMLADFRTQPQDRETPPNSRV